MEETIRIMRRNEEEITLSLHKIIKAITVAVHKILNEYIDHIQEALLSMLHSTWHCFMHWFYRKRHRKESSTGCPQHTFISTAFLLSYVKPSTSVFCRFSQRIRSIYLLRTQDRSNDCDDADNNFIRYATISV